MGVENLTLLSPSEEALTATPISYEIEQQVRLDNGFMEVGKFHWRAPVEIEVRSRADRVAFNLALSPRPSNGTLEEIDGPDEGRRLPLERVMLLNPGRPYRLRLPAGRLRSLYCEVDQTAIEELLPRPTALGQQDWREQSRPQLPVIELLLNRMYEELREERLAAETALGAYLRALCVELARCQRDSGAQPGKVRKGGLAPWRMRLLLERIQADAPAPRLPELADICRMTVRQLSRAFKEETGKALGGFVLEHTVERAVARLTQGDEQIAQIAAELGFANSTSFSYSFRRCTGMLPRDVRRRATVG